MNKFKELIDEMKNRSSELGDSGMSAGIEREAPSDLLLQERTVPKFKLPYSSEPESCAETWK